MIAEDSCVTDHDRSLEQQLSYLRQLAFFHDFDEDDMRQFLAVSKWCRVKMGSMIIREGTTERVFYLLVKGTAEVVKQSRNRKKVVLTTLQTGACFGEMALVGVSKRTADVIAKTETFVIRVDPDILEKSSVFLQLKFYKRFCETLVTRLDIANQRMAGKEPDIDQAMRQVLHVPPASFAAPASKPFPRRGKSSLTRITIPPPPPAAEDKLTQAQIKQLIRADQVRAVNPAVRLELRHILTSNLIEANTRRLAELIQYDPVITIWVLMLANSSSLRRGNQVNTVPQAMVVVGMKKLAEFIGDVLDESERYGMFSGFDELARRYWIHSVMVGKVAKMLQETIRISADADVYLAGLVHDLGMLALDQVSPHFYPQLLRPTEEFADLYQAEHRYIGADHGWAGAWLGKYFSLPPVIIETMRNHHTLMRVANHQETVALVGLADLFVQEREDYHFPAKGDQVEKIKQSYGWFLLQEKHQPFMEVDRLKFIDAFREELDKSWPEMIASIPV